MADLPYPFGGISGSTLKLIAIITMVIDHTGATILRTICKQPAVLSSASAYAFWNTLYTDSRSIGRIAFPIFAFLIGEGAQHTRNPQKYALRLFFFALISEIPFDLSLKCHWIYLSSQNVYFTLLLGLLAILVIRACREHPAAIVGATGLAMLAAHYLKTDYSYKGVFLIVVLYLLRYSRIYQCIGGAAAVTWELPAPVAFVPIWLYNGKKGWNLKYLFYCFYPVHLLILYLIKTYLVPMFFL